MKACIAIKVMLTTHHGFLEEARRVFFPFICGPGHQVLEQEIFEPARQMLLKVGICSSRRQFFLVFLKGAWDVLFLVRKRRTF